MMYKLHNNLVHFTTQTYISQMAGPSRTVYSQVYYVPHFRTECHRQSKLKFNSITQSYWSQRQAEKWGSIILNWDLLKQFDLCETQTHYRHTTDSTHTVQTQYRPSTDTLQTQYRHTTDSDTVQTHYRQYRHSTDPVQTQYRQYRHSNVCNVSVLLQKL